MLTYVLPELMTVFPPGLLVLEVTGADAEFVRLLSLCVEGNTLPLSEYCVDDRLEVLIWWPELALVELKTIFVEEALFDAVFN